MKEQFLIESHFTHDRLSDPLYESFRFDGADISCLNYQLYRLAILILLIYYNTYMFFLSDLLYTERLERKQENKLCSHILFAIKIKGEYSVLALPAYIWTVR